MQEKKHKNIIWITIVFIQIFTLFLFSISNINNSHKIEINKNMSFNPKDFTCQNGTYQDNQFHIKEIDIKDNTKPTLFTYGIREKVIAGIYQINIQYNTNDNNNYIEIIYYNKNNQILNKDKFYLQTQFNNMTENIEIDKNVDNIDVRTYYGNIGELKLSKININLINETTEINKCLILLCFFIIIDIFVYIILLIKNKVTKKKNKNNETLIVKKELNQIDSSQSSVSEIDEFFNEWLNSDKYKKLETNTKQISDDIYSNIIEHQLEDIIEINNKTNNNIKIDYNNEEFDFRYTEEDFAMTEDYKKGYVED